MAKRWYKQLNARGLYLFFIFGVFMYLMWTWIGNANPAVRQNTEFYLIMGLFGVVFLFFDYLADGVGAKNHVINTITIENKPDQWFSPKMCLLYAVIASTLLAFNILATQSAFVSYPKFQIFDAPIFNALASGLKGYIESLIFFNTLYPTLYGLFRNNQFIKSSGIVAGAFMGYHVFVYGSMIGALFMTVIFTYMSLASIRITGNKNSTISDGLHITNNTVGSLISAKVALVFSFVR